MKFNTITYLVTAAMTSFVLADNTNAIGATLRDIQATYQNADTNAALTGGRYVSNPRCWLACTNRSK
jgi:hypothetical protein